jgi:uncharacterized protein (DUF1015 family)
MAEIIPFAGIRYNAAKIGDLSTVMAPPYDVISPELQDELYRRSPYNVVRLDYGKEEPGDVEGRDKYSRARTELDGWLGEGMLVVEPRPCLYLYRMEYRTPAGAPKALSGIICMLRLEEWDKGVVLPHERTLKGPKTDRMALVKATGVSASQIFSLYSDPEKSITRAMDRAVGDRPPDIRAVDDDGAIHKVWAVEDPAAIEAARKALAGRPVFIADGHHRYETAIAYRDMCRARGPYTGGELFNFVPMYLANMEEEGLTVLPTHRLIRETRRLSSSEIIKTASRYFNVERIRFTASNEPAVRRGLLSRLVESGAALQSFGYFHKGGDSYYLLTIKDIAFVKEALGCERAEAYCNLDVTVLHSLIIERILGIDTDTIARSQQVKFEKDADRAIERVRSGEFDLCLLLNPTKVHEVREVALANEVMPQKSTYFYPKLLTGLVIAPIDR